MHHTDILYHVLEVIVVKLGNFLYTPQDNIVSDGFLRFFQ